MKDFLRAVLCALKARGITPDLLAQWPWTETYASSLGRVFVDPVDPQALRSWRAARRHLPTFSPAELILESRDDTTYVVGGVSARPDLIYGFGSAKLVLEYKSGRSGWRAGMDPSHLAQVLISAHLVAEEERCTAYPLLRYDDAVVLVAPSVRGRTTVERAIRHAVRPGQSSLPASVLARQVAPHFEALVPPVAEVHARRRAGIQAHAAFTGD